MLHELDPHIKFGPELDLERQEVMSAPEFKVIPVADGLGYGEGSISGEGDPDVLATLDSNIMHNKDLLVPIDKDENGKVITDDGCGDGRKAGLIFRAKEFFKHSLNRPKAFGGALVMSLAARIGLGQADGRKLQDAFVDTADKLDEIGLDYGAHTDESAHGENCGCGAIDKAPQAIQTAVKYEQNIRGIIDTLGISTQGLDDVFDGYRDYADTLPGQEYSGSKVMELIKGAGKLVKQLVGDHRERRIILNKVRGYTVDQELLRQVTGEEAQAFVVDVWHLEDIATALQPDDKDLRHKAFLGELVYTLGVAGVLTKGDLRVFVVQ